MNDNTVADSHHHAECLRLLNDLHDLFRWADGRKIQVASDIEGVEYALEWRFWADECGKVLGLMPAQKLSA